MQTALGTALEVRTVSFPTSGLQKSPWSKCTGLSLTLTLRASLANKRRLVPQGRRGEAEEEGLESSIAFTRLLRGCTQAEHPDFSFLLPDLPLLPPPRSKKQISAADVVCVPLRGAVLPEGRGYLWVLRLSSDLQLCSCKGGHFSLRGCRRLERERAPNACTQTASASSGSSWAFMQKKIIIIIILVMLSICAC